MCEARGYAPDHAGHLYTNMTKRVFICFRCGWKGRLDPENVPFVPTHLIQKSVEGGLVSRERNMQDSGIRLLPTEPETRVQARMLEYLSRRNVNVGMVRTWKLMYAAHGTYANRVVFPCFGDLGIEYFVARAIDPGVEPKTLHPPKNGLWPGKSEVLWGIERVEPGGSIVLCEGVFDAAVIPNGVALLGKYISMRQMQMVALRASRIVIALDGDAHNEALEIYSKIRRTYPRMNIATIILPRDKDPADLGPDAMYDKVREYL